MTQIDQPEILLAQPRGFCAGVDRAINIVNEALSRFGKPIYVRHEIVHNKYVVDELRTKGAVFVEELAARIKAVMHRKAPVQVDEIKVGHLSLDVVSHKVTWFEVTSVLSQREFNLLAFLMRSPGHIYSRQQILKHVWEINFDPETNVVDVCVRRIKRKLERGSQKMPSPIESVRGVGYRLKLEA